MSLLSAEKKEEEEEEEAPVDRPPNRTAVYRRSELEDELVAPPLSSLLSNVSFPFPVSS